jgi:antitoxin HicB
MSKTQRHFTIVLDPNPDEGTYTVTVPALPGCLTQGTTVQECIERAKEAITGWIASAEAHGEPIPEETMRPQVIDVAVAA